MENNFTGVAPDTRTEQEINKDWQHEELFGMGIYEWKEKPQESWNNYPIRNQNGSGKCGPFSGAKALGINNLKDTGEFVNLDTDFIYQKRTNQGAGMYMQQLLQILCDHGAPADPNLVSDNNSDEDSAKRTFTQDQKTEALKYRGKNYVFINTNIDTVASVVEQGYTPILLLRCAFSEYTAEPHVDPKVTPDNYGINHFVPVVDVTLYKGKKCLIVEDSWGQQYGNKGRRIFDENFFNNRVFQVGYIVDLPNGEDVKPKHTFNVDLVFGSRGEEVKWLQRCLVAEGLLKPEFVTGYFGHYTMSPVKEFQLKYRKEILTAAGVKLATGKVLRYTRAKLNQLYS